MTIRRKPKNGYMPRPKPSRERALQRVTELFAQNGTTEIEALSICSWIVGSICKRHNTAEGRDVAPKILAEFTAITIKSINADSTESTTNERQ